MCTIVGGLCGAVVEFTGSTVLSFFEEEAAVKTGAEGFKSLEEVSAKARSISFGLTTRAFLEGCRGVLATLGLFQCCSCQTRRKKNGRQEYL